MDSRLFNQLLVAKIHGFQEPMLDVPRNLALAAPQHFSGFADRVVSDNGWHGRHSLLLYRIHADCKVGGVRKVS